MPSLDSDSAPSFQLTISRVVWFALSTPLRGFFEVDSCISDVRIFFWFEYSAFTKGWSCLFQRQDRPRWFDSTTLLHRHVHEGGQSADFFCQHFLERLFVEASVRGQKWVMYFHPRQRHVKSIERTNAKGPIPCKLVEWICRQKLWSLYRRPWCRLTVLRVAWVDNYPQRKRPNNC